MKKQQIKAFTLVELIIVITILAILATIGFMSFQSYTADARDGKRKRDLANIRSGLEMYQAKKAILPMPDNYATLSSGTTIGYQGYAGTSILSLIRAGDSFQDPTDKGYYTYGIDTNKTKYQLLAMLEINPNATSYNENILNQTYAVDYTNRYSHTIGNFAVYLSGTTKTPIQEGNSGLPVTVTDSNISVVTSNVSNVSLGTGGGGGSTTYAISGCPTVNAAQNGTSPTRDNMLANINNYIGCTVAGYTGVIRGYTYSGSISRVNQMIMIVETIDTAGSYTTQWGLYGTDLGTLTNITALTNTITMTGDIVAWDGLSNTQKIVTRLTRTGETNRAAQLCNAKGNGRYLPATEELNQLYCYNNNDATNDGTYYGSGNVHADCVNKGYIAINKNTLSNFGTNYYWSSTEYSSDFSRSQIFSTGRRYTNVGKSGSFAVRCVSRF